MTQVCAECGSDAVYFDAYVGVNDETDVRVFQEVICERCSGSTHLMDEDEWDKQNPPSEGGEE